MHLVVVTDAMQLVDGGRDHRPGEVSGLGPCLVLPQEYPNLSCTSVDLDPEQGPAVVPLLERELAGPASAAVAIRGDRRWCSPCVACRRRPGRTDQRDRGCVTAARTCSPAASETSGSRWPGTSLGGLADPVWCSPAGVACRPGRTGTSVLGASPSGAVDSRTVQRIRGVLALEEQGAEVLVLAADAADPGDMARVVAAAREGRADPRRGPRRGDHRDERVPAVAEMSEDVAEAHFVAKADSLLALETALGDEPLDFCVLQSSISSVLGGLGFAAYAGANAVLDAAAARARRSGRAWMGINWDTWRTADAPAPTGLGASMAAYSMTVEEGLAALDRALASAVDRVVVSVGDLIQPSGAVGRGPPRHGVRPGGCPFPRPDLPVPFVAPARRFERRLAHLWCEALGLDRVGVNDNFFDLGGNSLIGLQASRVGDRGAALPAVVLFRGAHHQGIGRPPGCRHRGRQDAPGTVRRAGCGHRSADRTATGDIAIVGMAGRFPGAARRRRVLAEPARRRRVDLAFFTGRGARRRGRRRRCSRPDYVKAATGARRTSSSSTRRSSATARARPRLTDPQHRLFLECAGRRWSTPATTPALRRRGRGLRRHRHQHLPAASAYSDLQRDVSGLPGGHRQRQGLPHHRVSYKLDLTGPA